MLNYKVVEVSTKPIKETKELYKGTSRQDAIAAYNQPQSLLFSHKRMYEGKKRLYPYEF